jgi:hypothetical protein
VEEGGEENRSLHSNALAKTKKKFAVRMASVKRVVHKTIHLQVGALHYGTSHISPTMCIPQW